MNTADAAFSKVRSICLAYPGVSETQSWGHPNFRVGKRAFVTLETHAGRPSIAFRLCSDHVKELTTAVGFFATPYGRGQWVSLHADRRVAWKVVRELIDESYLLAAPAPCAARRAIPRRPAR